MSGFLALVVRHDFLFSYCAFKRDIRSWVSEIRYIVGGKRGKKEEKKSPGTFRRETVCLLLQIILATLHVPALFERQTGPCDVSGFPRS